MTISSTDIEIQRVLDACTGYTEGRNMIPHTESYLMWQYTNDPNDIQDAITTKNPDWEGLESLQQIISITYNTNHDCYVVFWIASREIMMDEMNTEDT